MSMNRIITAFLAVALALPAGAQLGRDTAAERMRRARQPAPQGQAQAPGQPAQADIVAFGEVHAYSQVATQAGDLAATRGASKEVKDLGRKIAAEHRQFDERFGALMKARDKDPATLPVPDRRQLDAELAQLNTKTGEEFDREFVAFLTRNGVAFVDALKRARDVFHGRDAELKRFLDDAENDEEAHLAAARQLKAKRQARTPPAR